MTVPSVAVVVPAFNAAGRIASCIRAIRSQTLAPHGVVVVDNGSTDNTASVADSAGATVVVENRQGSYAARNAGVRAVDSEVVAFTDDDCEPEPEWLERLVAPFSEADVAGTGGSIVAVETVTAAQRWARERRLLDQEANFSHAVLPFFATANAAYRRSALDAVGGFDEELQSGGDVDLAWRIQRADLGRLVFVADAAVRHHHRDKIRDLVRQQRRYGRGHVGLDQRWSHEPAYANAMGRPIQRLRAVWLLPARLPWRLIRRDDPMLPIVDCAVLLARELGRWEGRRMAERTATSPLPSDP